jgi:hypothetical protein
MFAPGPGRPVRKGFGAEPFDAGTIPFGSYVEIHPKWIWPIFSPCQQNPPFEALKNGLTGSGLCNVRVKINHYSFDRWFSQAKNSSLSSHDFKALDRDETKPPTRAIPSVELWLSPMIRMIALPTMIPSAKRLTSLACPGVEIPKPTATGL